MLGPAGLQFGADEERRWGLMEKGIAVARLVKRGRRGKWCMVL